MPRGESRDATAQPHVAASPAQQEDHVQQHTDGSMDPFDESGGAALDAFTSAIESDPAAILQPIPQLGNLAKSAVKVLYDHQAQDQHTTGSAGCLRGGGGGVVLPELYVDGFDAEQIWLQLDLAIKPALKRARKLLSKAGQDPVLLTREAEDALDELLVLERSSSEEQDTEGDADDALLAEDFSEDNATATADLASIDYDALLQAGAAQFSRRRPQDTSSSDDEGEAQLAKQQQQSTRGRKANSATAVRATVEDDHFKLDEMEAFVQQAEREEAGLETGENDGDAATSDEEADLEAVLDQVAASSGRGGKLKQGHKRKLESVGDLVDDEQLEEMGAAAMYEDFFGPRLGSRFTVSPQSGEDARGRGLGGADTDGIGSSDDDEDGFNDDLLSGDMLSGEDDEQGGGESSMELRDRGTALEGRSTVDVEGHDLLADSDEEEAEEEQAPSAHQRRQQRLQEKIRRLEEVALGEKDWFMRGEVDAGRRPKNSALEVDLDFETTVKPPPQPTEEMTRTLDELIKARIAEGRFDDVVRIEPPAPEAKRTAVELDDRKPPQGLGELYEQEYMQAVTGAAADKDEEVRQQARAQLAVLFAKLDSLSHLHFTPRPVMEEVAVKVDVPAIMMEEAAPQYVSGASMQAPEEVFATEAGGAPHAEEELTREERKRRRAQRKRAGKNRRAAKEEQRAQNPSLAGRKSAAEQEAARKMVKTAGMGRAASSSRTNSEYGRSNAVFAKIQGGGTFAAKQAGAPAPIEHLKL